MVQINKNSRIPLYLQLYEILRERILQGEWKPGDMIPPEPDLIQYYQVSRNTIRDVLEMLVNEGYIHRQQGRGTYVSHPTMEQALVRIINFTQDMSQRGIKASSKVISSELLLAPEDIAEKLLVNPGEELGMLKRLRMGNDEPMSVEESYFIHRFCPDFLTRHDYSQFSLREAMAQDYNIRFSRAKQVIRAINAPREIAHFLDVPTRSPLLFIERVTFSEQDIPVEFMRVYYRGDRYSLFNELHS